MNINILCVTIKRLSFFSVKLTNTVIFFSQQRRSWNLTEWSHHLQDYWHCLTHSHLIWIFSSKEQNVFLPCQPLKGDVSRHGMLKYNWRDKAAPKVLFLLSCSIGLPYCLVNRLGQPVRALIHGLWASTMPPFPNVIILLLLQVMALDEAGCLQGLWLLISNEGERGMWEHPKLVRLKRHYHSQRFFLDHRSTHVIFKSWTIIF